MLSEEQAIENLKDFKSISILYGNTFTMFLEQLKKYQEATETVLNFITKLQKENEKYKYLYEKALDNTVKSDKENMELKKQIDLIVRYLASLDIEEDICEKTGRLNECDGIALGECEDCIKQYFAKLAKKGE